MSTLVLTPGDHMIYDIAIEDENGDPYSLAGCTLWFTAKLRKFNTDNEAIAKLYWVSGGSAAGITVSDPASGEATIRLTPTETADFIRDAHYWDLQLKDAAGVIRTVDEGILIVRQSVTIRTTTP